jgi:hypothetical protein
MRFVFGLMGLCTLLSACERYTEKKSPCFGNTGKPIVTRAAQTPLTINVSTSQAIENESSKDCLFHDLGKPLE